MTATATRKPLTYIHDDVEFYAHQIEGVRTLAKRTSFILADEMGLGKSLQALTVAAVDFERDRAHRVLVVCPATLKGNWFDEIVEHTSFGAMVLDGTPKQREAQLQQFSQGSPHDFQILIVNYEQVVKHLLDFNRLNFDIIVYDEAHAIKNNKAKRTKACLKLHADRHFLLTGSPLLNHVNELWTLLHRCDPQRFPSYWKFVNRYCVWGGWQDKQIVGVKNEAELRAIVDDYMLRRLKSDVLDLPDKQYIPVRVDLTSAQRKLYDQINDDLMLSMPDNPNPMEIENALTKFLRLKQVCGTTAAFGYEDSSGKLDSAMEKVDEIVVEGGEKLVMFTQFRGVIAAFEQRCIKAGIPVTVIHGDVPRAERMPRIRAWADATEPGVVACMYQVGGVGLNMTAANKMIRIDKLFVPKLNEQAEDRIHRIGASTSQPVQIIDYIARNTIESRIETILRTKKKVFESIVDSGDFKKKLIAALLAGDEEDE